MLRDSSGLGLHVPAKAKRMIFIFLAGGPSQGDLFAPKEYISRKHGEAIDSPVEDDGQLRVGLTDDELVAFAGDRAVAKASERDLGVLIGMRRSGATTVAATVAVAALAGIGVMATGGLGGVHRGGELSLDVSADLTTLTPPAFPRPPVCTWAFTAATGPSSS